MRDGKISLHLLNAGSPTTVYVYIYMHIYGIVGFENITYKAQQIPVKPPSPDTSKGYCRPDGTCAEPLPRFDSQIGQKGRCAEMKGRSMGDLG